MAFASPLPPNRTGGFPASGSPVDSFLVSKDWHSAPWIVDLRTIHVLKSIPAPFDNITGAANMLSVHTNGSFCIQWTQSSFPCLGVVATRENCSSISMSFLHPSSYPAFAPRQLQRFIATMRALTPLRFSHRRRGLPASRIHDSERPATNHMMHLRHGFYAPFQYPTHSRAFVLLAGSSIHTLWVSPYLSWLTGASCRIVFVILRAALSFSVALHPVLRRRSYFKVQA